VVFKRGVSLRAQILEGRGSSTNDCWRHKTRVPRLSRGVVYGILRLAVLIIPAYDRHTHTHADRRRRLIPAHTVASAAWIKILHKYTVARGTYSRTVQAVSNAVGCNSSYSICIVVWKYYYSMEMV